MPAPDRPTNAFTISARHIQEALRAETQEAYETYLISRSRGIDSAIQPAWECWNRAEQKYLLTCHPSKWAAPGDAESPGGAPEVGVPGALLEAKEDPRIDQLLDQVALMRGDVVRNAVKLEAILAAMQATLKFEEYVLKGDGTGDVPVGVFGGLDPATGPDRTVVQPIQEQQG